MILLLFFFPVAVYLLVLGGINRRRYPLMVSGVWDFIGVLFAASGFLLFGGPAILSSMNERTRGFWLLGRDGLAQANPEGNWQLWVFLSLLYFGLVVLGAGFMLWRSRSLTSIYNVEPAVVEHLLEQVLTRLRLNPVRSGGLYLFGLAGEPAPPAPSTTHESIQAPHYLPGPVSKRVDVPPAGGEGEFMGRPRSSRSRAFPACAMSPCAGTRSIASFGGRSKPSCGKCCPGRRARKRTLASG